MKKLTAIINRIKQLCFEEKYDLVVGIARGGIVPGYLISSHLDVPLELVWINFRDDNHKTSRSKPKLLKKIDFDYRGKKILLVDDRVNSGMTMETVKKLLIGAEVKTLAVNGKADFSLFNEKCFKMPWSLR